MALTTDFMGLKLKNPIIIAAGPWSRNGDMVRRAFQAGAGAVVTETIVSELNPDVRPRLAYDGRGVQNIRLYSDMLIEEWEREMIIAKSEGGVVIASVCAQTPSEIKYLAQKMERIGADAIELGVASPMGEGVEVIASSPERVYELTKAVVESVKIPVMVKLSQNVSNIARIARAAEKAGAHGISAIDTVRCIIGVDVSTGKPMLATYGGYSGAPIKPLGLASVATIAQSVKIPVCGIGGISTADNVLEYMMLGATTVQIGTAVMIEGYGIIEKILADLEKWQRERKRTSLSEIRGIALQELKAFDEIALEPKTAKDPGKDCSDPDCRKCMDCCVYDAIVKMDGRIRIDQGLCRGCGLCVDLCPDGIIELKW